MPSQTARGALIFTCLVLIWGARCFAASPYDGKTAYEILEILPGQLVGLSEAQAQDFIKRAQRRLAIRLHPDKMHMKQHDEKTKLQMMAQVNSAADELKKRFGRGSKANSSKRGTDGGDTFNSADFFRRAQDDGYAIYKQMESERAASMNPDQRFPSSPTRATWAALMGGGFGDLNFYRRYPATEAAFLEFMREHLDDLFDPRAEWPLNKEEVEKLEGAVERSGNPADLAKAVWSWKQAKGWEVGPDPCHFAELSGAPKRGLPAPSRRRKSK